jgi:hypothetical protein
MGHREANLGKGASRPTREQDPDAAEGHGPRTLITVRRRTVRSTFWDDLAEDMRVPRLRRVFERTLRRLRVQDWRRRRAVGRRLALAAQIAAVLRADPKLAEMVSWHLEDAQTAAEASSRAGLRAHADGRVHPTSGTIYADVAGPVPVVWNGGKSTRSGEEK